LKLKRQQGIVVVYEGIKMDLELRRVCYWAFARPSEADCTRKPILRIG
jgi:hypothetical protein